MKNAKHMSESIELGIVLAIAGGFMDAYSYMCRGEVFANAQTGNMLLLGINLSKGDIVSALRYFFPVVFFAMGIILAHGLKIKADKYNKLHWRQSSVLFEMSILIFVSFLPQSSNLLANSLTSFACGIQVQSFRKIHGNGIATTMCIGNLRSGTQNVCDYFNTKDNSSLKKGLLYYGIISFFIIGAIIGNFMVGKFCEKAILFDALILAVVFVMMFWKRSYLAN